jgi:CDP-diacylglycerol--glycerol-3-phosphate 3-phosphatidyltransferase
VSLADTLAIARALAVVPIVWAIANEQHDLALGMFLIAASTDALDGWIARRRGTTALGALLDPLADKVLVVGALIALSAIGVGWPVTLVAVATGARELVVAVARVRAFRRGTALPADSLAKAKTIAQLVGVALIIVGGRPWAVLGAGIVGLAFAVSLLTLRRYLTTPLA